MKQYIQVGTILILMITGIILLFLALRQLAPLAILILIAIVITTGIDPLVQRLQKTFARWWRMPRSLATLLVLLIGLLVIAGIFAFLLFTAISEAIRFAQVIGPTLVPQVESWMADLSSRYHFIPNPDTIIERLREQSGKIASYLWTTTIAFFGVIGGVFSAVTVFILTFFFTTYKDGITYTFLQLIPVKYQARTREIGHDAAQKMGGWLRGQLILALIVTVSVSLVMMLIGVPYPILIGIIGGVGELIPMVGPYVAFFPALGIALLTGQPLWVIIVIIVFFIALTQTENYVLAPKIMERQVGLHPVTTILALFTGGALLGLVGALLAIPLTAAGKVIMLQVVFPAIQRKSAEQIVENRPEAKQQQQQSRRKRRKNG